MCIFYIRLIYNCIMHRCINFGMPQELLNLLNGHSFFNCHGCHGPAEFVRVYVFDLSRVAKTVEKMFHAGNGQAVIRCVEGNEQSRIFIGSGCQILLQVDLCFGIKIDRAFFVAFAQDDTLPFIKADIGAIQFDQFPDTDSRGSQQIQQCPVTGMGTVVTESLQHFVGKGLFYQFCCLDFVDASDGAFRNIVLVFQPGKERGKDAPDIVQGYLAAVAGSLING